MHQVLKPLGTHETLNLSLGLPHHHTLAPLPLLMATNPTTTTTTTTTTTQKMAPALGPSMSLSMSVHSGMGLPSLPQSSSSPSSSSSSSPSHLLAASSPSAPVSPQMAYASLSKKQSEMVLSGGLPFRLGQGGFLVCGNIECNKRFKEGDRRSNFSTKGAFQRHCLTCGKDTRVRCPSCSMKVLRRNLVRHQRRSICVQRRHLLSSGVLSPSDALHDDEDDDEDDEDTFSSSSSSSSSSCSEDSRSPVGTKRPRPFAVSESDEFADIPCSSSPSSSSSSSLSSPSGFSTSIDMESRREGQGQEPSAKRARSSPSFLPHLPHLPSFSLLHSQAHSFEASFPLRHLQSQGQSQSQGQGQNQSMVLPSFHSLEESSRLPVAGGATGYGMMVPQQQQQQQQRVARTYKSKSPKVAKAPKVAKTTRRSRLTSSASAVVEGSSVPRLVSDLVEEEEDEILSALCSLRYQPPSPPSSSSSAASPSFPVLPTSPSSAPIPVPVPVAAPAPQFISRDLPSFSLPAIAH